jgi:hypothetical protein
MRSGAGSRGRAASRESEGRASSEGAELVGEAGERRERRRRRGGAEWLAPMISFFILGGVEEEDFFSDRLLGIMDEGGDFGDV